MLSPFRYVMAIVFAVLSDATFSPSRMTEGHDSPFCYAMFLVFAVLSNPTFFFPSLIIQSGTMCRRLLASRAIPSGAATSSRTMLPLLLPRSRLPATALAATTPPGMTLTPRSKTRMP